ncbi:MAG: hypothetical protein ACXVCI_12045 [Bdellovibrionota bacterium]
MMAGDDETPAPVDFAELPPVEMPADAPAEGLPQDIEPKEFLVSDTDSQPQYGDAPPEEMPSGEGTNPAVSVEEMLSAEMLPEGLDSLPAADAGASLPQQPTFQLRLHSLTSESAAALKKALDAQGAAMPDHAWTSASPIVSQLTEYQLITLLQAARALGIPADASVILPDAVPTEDDLALGDLSQVPDPELPQVESAPSVTLPKGEKEVMLCTPDSLPGGTVRETFGIVIAHRSIARRIFREEDLKEKLSRELRAVPKGASAPVPSSHLQLLLRDLMLDLRKSALAKGANSVLGVKLEAFPESGGSDPQLEQLRLVAFGTAAVVEKG